MNYLSIPKLDDLPEAAKNRYNDQITKNGQITNMKKTLLHSIVSFDALMEWYPLFEALQALIGSRATYFYAYAISSENECLLCSTFFVKIFTELGLTYDNFEFTDDEHRLTRYGRLLVNRAHEIDDELRNELKERYGEAGVVLLTSFAGLMIATNLINTALKIPVDSYLSGFLK